MNEQELNDKIANLENKFNYLLEKHNDLCERLVNSNISSPTQFDDLYCDPNDNYNNDQINDRDEFL